MDMTPFLVPLPFLLVMLAALAVPQRQARHVGYLGALAGIATLALAWLSRGAGQEELDWFSVGGEAFSLSMLADPLSLVLACIVALIGTFVFLYSTAYFEEGERGLKRYFFLLSLFAWSMLGAVLSGSLLQLFVCWELVGISSYLLIGFWHRKEEAVRASRKALLTIVVGDTLLLGAIMLLRVRYGTFDILSILSALRPDTLTLLAGIGIVAGAISKSAQFPLHAWLPDAMAGPTPVSAFLHSATMVKAGLFLVARMLPLLAIAGLLPWIAAIAVLTIIMSACMALVENDIKRALAYSTMNHLGFVLLALSAGAIAAGAYHMLTHSVAKALLFFTAGVAIHATGTQDMTRMRLALGPNMLAACAALGALSLAGAVPLAGFFSKETLLEALVAQGRPELVALFALATLLSAAYIVRWYLLIFVPGGKRAHAPWQMLLPLPVLAALSLAFGALALPVFRAFGAHAPHFLTPGAALSCALVLAGGLLAYAVTVRGAFAWLPRSALAALARERFLMDRIVSAAAALVMGVASMCAWAEGRIVDRTVRGIGEGCASLGRLMRRMQTGRLATYAAALVLGFVALVIALEVLV